MRYRIEYADNGRCDFVNGRADLIEQIRTASRTISDVRKIFKSGVSDSVMETYKNFIKGCCSSQRTGF